MSGTELEVTFVEQKHKQLGRQRVHDPRSKSFPARAAVDKTKWVNKSLRIYDPKVNPNQCHGECTGVAKCVQFNAAGNRKSGVILDMDDAHSFYHTATTLDPFKGTWPPDDTGSSGLASAKAAKKLGLGSDYLHVFGGADEIVQLVQEGHVVSTGTWWYEGMMTPDEHGIIEPTGNQVGGHQYGVFGYNVAGDMVKLRCWWGPTFRDVWMRREHLNELVLDGGDAHIQTRVTT